MSTQLANVVIDSNDMPALARFWATALDWLMFDGHTGEIGVSPTTDRAFELVFVPVSDPKTDKNRIHLDLTSQTKEEQRDIVQRLLELGATHADVGQVDVPWIVMADPEGNEFCVLEPRDELMGIGSLAAIVVDAADPRALATFWQAAANMIVVADAEWGVCLQSPFGGPRLEFITFGDQKVVKNRIHLDVAPAVGSDQAAEVERLASLGARPVDIGQGDVGWVVMIDPEGNEFCVLSPR